MLKGLILTVAAVLSANSGQTIQEKVYTIPEGVSVISADIEWNAMTMFSKDDGELPKIWYKKNGTWMPWHNFEENEVNQTNSLELLFAGNTRKSITIKSDETVEVVAHFFNTHIPGENLVARFDPFDDDSFDDPRTGLARPVSGPKYISRSEWGADETLRIRTFARGIKSWFRASVPEAKDVPKYLRPKVLTRKNKDGKTLTWPIEKNQKIKKFIVHHTGEYIDERRDPKELMRAIYYFHTITRGWGDIGYNYVIDKQGNIYEGRYGGPDTVGAHTAYHNVASMGVSLMGNFNIEKPTEKQIKVLELTLADHAVRFGVDPMGKGLFLGTNSYNISGHQDVARKGHGTACPGKNLEAMLPEIRKKVAYFAREINKNHGPTARDFLTKSKFAPKFKHTVAPKTKDLPVASLSKLLTKKIVQRGDKTTFDITLKNNGKSTWNKGMKLLVINKPEGLIMTPFRSVSKIFPNDSGIFRARVWVKDVPNGNYDIEFRPDVQLPEDYEGEVPSFVYPLQVSGDRPQLTKSFKESVQRVSSRLRTSVIKPPVTTVDLEEMYGPDVKVKLAFFHKNYAILESDSRVEVRSKGKHIGMIEKRTEIKVIPTGKNRSFKVISGDNEWNIVQPVFVTDGILKIKNYNRGLGKIAYNRFRRQLNFYATEGRGFYIVNQLPIEQYLWGLAEEPSHEPEAKKHAIYILARSYAYVYGGNKRKFKTPLYDLEDDPASSQFYLGYDWEYYHSGQKKLIEETKGKVITYNGRAVIGPYFTQSGGASSNAWHKQYPWTRAQKLPYDEGLEPRGHGVGLSGHTARKLAEKGKTYEEILDYFYDGIKVEKEF